MKSLTIVFCCLLSSFLLFTGCQKDNSPPETAPSTTEITATVSSSGSIEIISEIVSPDKVQVAKSSATIPSHKGNRIEFYDTAPNIIVIDSKSITISSGETVDIHIDPCVWAPEHYDLELGLWNEYTNTCYPETISGGNVSDSFYYSGLPAGTYKIYIKNLGTTALTTGYMLYTVSYPHG